MTRYVALWRGINVGKAKRLAMADLKALLTELGATNVVTLLNSGNAVFDIRKKITGEAIRKAVAARLGVDALVILKTASEWAAIAERLPIPEADDPSRTLVVITADTTGLQSVAGVAVSGDEQLVVTGHAAYVWCANGILESQALGEVFQKIAATSSTTRNWATVTKLDALANPR
ncbi:DUF1697 domain-containing protein [Roseateles sp. LYH14W]|uniref:DUF1697 domain-containing protein n=1 Tax=Pelomonas parva TaxID=3299032 RepID=A0ABW7EWM9_9BURK